MKRRCDAIGWIIRRVDDLVLDAPALLQVMGRWDSDIWAIYTRVCLHQVLDFAQAATAVEDPDLEALNPSFTQAARRARS